MAKLAKSYDNQSIAYENAYKLSIQKIKKIVKPHQEILEIACGTGIITFGIADSVKKITAIDLSPNMINIAKEKAHTLNKTNIDFKVADGYNLPYEDEQFDVILLFNVLHIIKEPENQLKEAYRLLKKGGYLITATDCNAELVPLKIKFRLIFQNILNKIGIIPYLTNYKTHDLKNITKT